LRLRLETMDESAPRKDPSGSAYEAELAEERRLWEAIHDHDLKATDRVAAYARWRAAVKRLQDLGISPGRGPADGQE
jgi:hypothetical protein